MRQQHLRAACRFGTSPNPKCPTRWKATGEGEGAQGDGRKQGDRRYAFSITPCHAQVVCLEGVIRPGVFGWKCIMR